MRRCLLLAAVAAAGLPRNAGGQSALPLLLDRDMTVGAGATVVAAFGAAVDRAEATVVPDRLFRERGAARRAANIAYRLLKLSYFDGPQEAWLLVANHELVGHGGRLRERFDGPIGYRVDPPAPYGRGGGATSFEFDREPTLHDLLAVMAAGMEANAVAAGLIADRAFRDGRMRPRDALRYFGFELDTLTYVLRTGDEPESPGHDVSDFVQTYNDLADGAGARRLTPRGLRRQVLAGLANPMLGYAVFGIGRHLWNGATDVRVPALSIAGVRCLPMVRYRLAPYGTEWSLVNALAGRVKPTRIEIRVARALQARPWSVGVRSQGVATWRTWRMDLGLDLWRQPHIAGTVPDAAIDADLHLGGAIHGRFERSLGRLRFGSMPLSAVVDLSLKTSGFTPGEPLRAGAVVRGGVGIPLAPWRP